MNQKIIALTTVVLTIAATGASAATRLVGSGCCPLCK